MADQNNKSTISSLSDFSILAERLAGSNRDNRATDKLNKNLESLNKNILNFAKNILPRTGLGRDIASISESRRTFQSLGERIRGNLFGTGSDTKFGSARGLLNTFGIVNKGSGGIVDQMLERRETKQQFIRDQLKVNPQMTDTPENRKTFGLKFETQQKIQKQLNNVQAEITRLEDQGFTEKQIARTGLFKQRDDQSAKLIASDNRLYSKIRDEMNESIKEGILEGIQEAAAEAQEAFSKMKPDDPAFQRAFDAVATPGMKAGTEEINEQELIQQAILKAQEEVVANTAAIVDALEQEPDQVVEKKSSFLGGWLKTILGTIGGFIIAKMSGIVGLLGTTISKVLSPILKFLGMGNAAKAVTGGAGAATAAGAAVAKGAGTLSEKARDLVKFVSPKIATAGKFAAGLLLSKPAMIAAAVAGVSSIGYSLLPDDTRATIENKVSKFLGTNEEKTQVAKKVLDEQSKVEKVSGSKLGDIITKSTEDIKKSQSEIVGKGTATVISAPTTNNNSSSVVNNHIMSNPRNTEMTFNKYLVNRYSA